MFIRQRTRKIVWFSAVIWRGLDHPCKGRSQTKNERINWNFCTWQNNDIFYIYLKELLFDRVIAQTSIYATTKWLNKWSNENPTSKSMCVRGKRKWTKLLQKSMQQNSNSVTNKPFKSCASEKIRFWCFSGHMSDNGIEIRTKRKRTERKEHTAISKKQQRKQKTPPNHTETTVWSLYDDVDRKCATCIECDVNRECIPTLKVNVHMSFAFIQDKNVLAHYKASACEKRTHQQRVHTRMYMNIMKLLMMSMMTTDDVDASQAAS